MVEQLQPPRGSQRLPLDRLHPHGKKLQIGDETSKLEREYALLVTKSGPS